MKMRKIFATLMMAVATTAMVSSCSKDDDGAPDINGTYTGDVEVYIGPESMVSPIEVSDVTITIASTGDKTMLTANVTLPSGPTLPLSIELTNLTEKKVSKSGTEMGMTYSFDLNGTAFKVPSTTIQVPLGPGASATFTLSGGDIATADMEMDFNEFAGFAGIQGVAKTSIMGQSETSTGVSVMLVGTVANMPGVLNGTPVTIYLEGEK